MVYVSSDWHGIPLSEIKSLLKQANFSEEDYLIVLGDVIDRGKNGIELLKWLTVQPNVELILGNHESMLLSCDFLFEEITEDSVDSLTGRKLFLLDRWQSNGADPTIEALSKESSETRADILAYLREAPLYDSVCVNDRDYVLVHGGLGNFHPDKKLCDYAENELVWTRPDFNTHYSSDYITVVGHTPTVFYGAQYSRKMIKTNTWWNIDTGAACGLKPMLLCLDTLQEYYLPTEKKA